MARLTQGSKLKGLRGSLARKQGLVVRRMYGKTWVYMVTNPYKGSRSSHQVANSNKFRDVVAQVKVAMQDVGQYAYWKDAYTAYKRSWKRGMKKYATLRGFMIGQLYAKSMVVTEQYDSHLLQKEQLIRYYEAIIQRQAREIGRLKKVVGSLKANPYRGYVGSLEANSYRGYVGLLEANPYRVTFRPPTP